MLQEAELLVACREGEVVASRQASSLLGAEGRVGQEESRRRKRSAFGRESIAIAHTGGVLVRLQAMENHVHQRQAVGILHMLHSVERAARVLPLFALGPLVRSRVLADKAVGGDQEATGAGGGILDHIAERRLHHRHHAVDQRPRREVLAGPRLLLVGVLLQKAFVQIAEPLLPRRVPVELVDLAHKRRERRRLLDEGACIGEDLLDQRRAIAAEMDQGELVVLQPVESGAGFEIIPAVVVGELIFRAGLLGHLQEEQIGQLGHILVVGDAIVLQDVAEVPELLDYVVGDCVQCV